MTWYTGNPFYDSVLAFGLVPTTLVGMAQGFTQSPYGCFASDKMSINLNPLNLHLRLGWWLGARETSSTTACCSKKSPTACPPRPRCSPMATLLGSNLDPQQSARLGGAGSGKLVRRRWHWHCRREASITQVTRHDVLAYSSKQFAAAMARGYAIDLDALANAQYRGISLNLPGFVDRLTWKVFRKTFYRDPATGTHRGWNVRMVQRGIDAPSEPMRRADGTPKTFGHYLVRDARSLKVARGYNAGIFLDYIAARNPLSDPGRFAAAPVVALNAGDPTLLLGWEYLKLGPFSVPTPSYWLLEYEGPIEEIVAPPDPAAR